MPPAYRAPSGRVTARSAGGRFRRSTLEDLGVANVNRGEITCCEFCAAPFWPVLNTRSACWLCAPDEKG